METLITASPEFFKGKKRAEVRASFERAPELIEQKLSKGNIMSAVVHMDEKTSHMHLSFVPLTEDKRLSAKDIVGNRKKLVWWQDEFRKFMVKQYPDLESNLIAKYADALDIDSLPEPKSDSKGTKTNEIDNTNFNSCIDAKDAARYNKREN